MKAQIVEHRYSELIDQTFQFPQEDFYTEEGELYFHGIPIMDIIKQYGTPLKLSYLPQISNQIQRAKTWFKVAMAKANYRGTYEYCYCTKSSHFSYVLDEALQNDIHIETSSDFDISIIQNLYQEKKIDKNIFIVCNGYKKVAYKKLIVDLIKDGFQNVIPIIDNKEELDYYEAAKLNKQKVGIRIASEEEPNFEFYTSRLGIRYSEILDFYHTKIKDNPRFELKMLHFFINTGIEDTAYYWAELLKCINVYCQLKKVCPTLDSMDIGGGFPIRNSLGFEYDYQYMADEIIMKIKSVCEQEDVHEPNIFTEFGKFTVGESGAVLYKIMGEKKQNDSELWYMIDSSFITTLPDAYALGHRYILLPINLWDNNYQRVNLGGLTCDSQDFYNAEAHQNQVYLPKLSKNEDLYIGFFHTGAYQESVGGFGGLQHCLIPAPKHVLIDKDEKGNISTKLFAKEQSAKSMLKILGY